MMHSWAYANIKVEFVVKECPYFRKDENRKPCALLREKALTILGIIKERGTVSTDELLQRLADKGVEREEARKLIDLMLKNGTIYEPRKGHLKLVGCSKLA